MSQAKGGSAAMHPQYSAQGSTYGAQSTVSSMAGRRSHVPPPRIRPHMIIIMVLAVGLLFIGLIMTIIAVWPGYTPVGGNPLKIAGPILLSIGAFVFIVGIICMCYLDNSRKKKAIRQQQLLYAQSMSRTTLNSYNMQQPTTPTPSTDAKPGRSILKKAGSTSTYNGTAKGPESDSGMAGTNNSFSTNRSYESGESESGSGSAGLGNVQVSMNPDPSAARQKGRAAQRTPAYSNQGYHGDGHDGYDPQRRMQSQPPPQQQRRPMQTYQNQGYDMYEPQTPSGGITGQGLLTGHGLLTGQGQLSPYGGSPAAAPLPQQSQQRGWGGNRPHTGSSNTAYQHDTSVSTVSQQYHSSTPRQEYQSSHHQHSEPSTPSASTEV